MKLLTPIGTKPLAVVLVVIGLLALAKVSPREFLFDELHEG